ncbi:MAG TPA: hypothetical protein VHZ04_03415 [Candidatus Paceibacterota bacterium]|jgi:hypothetical protein|nr:hypothetical protein [Candidatus Paceibacterota bacterium]
MNPVRTTLVAVLFALSLFVPKISHAQTSPLIYEENFSNNSFEQGWANWSWSTNLSNTSSTAYRGVNCLAVQYNAQWAGLYFYDGNGFNTTGYDTLALAVNGGSSGGQTLTVQVKDAAGNVIGSANAGDYLAGGVVPANNWVTVDIPLAALNATNTNVYGVIVMNATNTTLTTIYVDDVRFDNAGIGFPGNIYSDAIAPGWLNYSWVQSLQMYGAGSARHGYKEIRAFFENQWDGVYFYNPNGVPVSGYNYLNFSVVGDQTGYNDLAGTQIQLRDVNQNVFGSVQLSSYIIGSITAAQWYDFSIPLSDFGVQQTDTLGGIVFERSSTYTTNVWFDDINIAAYRRYSASGNERRNVVLEAFYALHPQHDGGCDTYISGDCVGSWNYLNDDATFPASASGQSDTSSYGTLKGDYDCNSSVWVISTSDPCYYSPDDHTFPVNFYNFAADYGYAPWGGSNGPIGRGGQCTYFANLVLWRSGLKNFVFPYLSVMWDNTDSNLQDAVEGDILQYYDSSGHTTNHVAIVVQIYRTGDTITALDTIDANYLTDNNTQPSDREIIGRHAFCVVSSGCPFNNVQMIQNVYRIWMGTPYYNTAYVAD